MANYTVRIDEKLRNEATELFESMGFTLPSAINAFLRRSVAEQGFPFQLKAIDRLLSWNTHLSSWKMHSETVRRWSLS